MKEIADGETWTIPATIDKPKVLEETGGAWGRPASWKRCPYPRRRSKGQKRRSSSAGDGLILQNSAGGPSTSSAFFDEAALGGVAVGARLRRNPHPEEGALAPVSKDEGVRWSVQQVTRAFTDRCPLSPGKSMKNGHVARFK
jgi:hypothetical protein